MNGRLPQIHGYSAFRPIGRGGSASVYRAIQIELEREVAVKVLNRSLTDERSRSLFDAERRALGRLAKHRNVVTVFDGGLTNAGEPFLAMELCRSGSLSALVKRSGPIGVDLAVRCGLRISEALAHSHRQSMVHRDVKPENVLISESGEPVLSDFGIASFLESENTATEGAWSAHYVAPELMRSSSPSAVTDVYSLGATVFTLLVGHHPHVSFPGEKPDLPTILNRLVDPAWRPAVPPSAEAPKELVSLLQHLMEKNPNRRIPSADEAATRFRTVERLLENDSRNLPLPVSHVEELDPLDLANQLPDPDSTYMEQGDRSLSGRLSRHSSRVTRLDDGFERGGASNTDDDATRIQAKTDSANKFGPRDEGDESERSDLDDSGRSSKSVPPKYVLGALAGLVAVVAAVAATTRSGSSSGTLPPSTVAGAVKAADGPVALSRPTQVSVRVLDGQAEIYWDPKPDPAISYEVERLVNGEVVETLDAAQPPLRVSGIAKLSRPLCVRVVALDLATSRMAPADTVCESTPAPEGTVSGE